MNRPTTSEAELKLYCGCMEDIKRRLKLIRAVASGQVDLGMQQFNHELIAINLRKSLEQIAFSSLVAQKDIYAAVDAKYSSRWRAKDLLNEIRKLHADFYPMAMEFATGQALQPRKVADHLTEADFVFLYDQMSHLIHAPNPFAGHRTINLSRPIAEWVARIEALLGVHTVRLAASADVWIVVMSDPATGHVRAVGATPLGPAPSTTVAAQS